MAPISSKLRVVWRPWEGDDIAYVGHSGNEQHQPFEADAEPRMRCRAETACIEEPVHLFHGYVHFFHPLDELIEPFFALRAAHHFADAGKEDVHGTDGTA